MAPSTSPFFPLEFFNHSHVVIIEEIKGKEKNMRLFKRIEGRGPSIPQEISQGEETKEEAEKIVSSSISQTELGRREEKTERLEEEEREFQLNKEVESEFKNIEREIIERDRVPVSVEERKEMKAQGVDKTIEKTIKESLPLTLEEILDEFKSCTIARLNKNNLYKTSKMAETFCKKLERFTGMAIDLKRDMSGGHLVKTIEDFGRVSAKNGYPGVTEQAMSSLKRIAEKIPESERLTPKGTIRHSALESLDSLGRIVAKEKEK